MKKFVSLLLAGTCVFSGAMLSACGSGGGSVGENVLKVYTLSQGYGHTWLENIAKEFVKESWVQEQFPGASVDVDYSELEASASTYITSGNANPYDVLFAASQFSSYMIPGGYLKDLTEDVYEKNVPGENVLFKNKIHSNSVLDSVAYEDNGKKVYYAIPYQQGFTGIVYNATVLEELRLEEPRTTDEWVAVMETVKGLGANEYYNPTTSLITYGGSAYMEYLIHTWWGQYEGAEEYRNFFEGYDSATGELSPAVLQQRGRLEALKALEAVAGKSKGYTAIEPNVGRATYMNAQTRLLVGEALFMANGAWFNNEMKTIRQGLIKKYGSVDEVKFMRTPVVSSIIEKTQSIPDDETLSNVIAAIDNGESSYGTVTPADFATIKNARSYYYSGRDASGAVIPNSTHNYELATAFVRYLATDKAIEIYMRDTDGCDTPFAYDLENKNSELFNGLSAFQKDRLSDLYKKGLQPLPMPAMCPLVKDGGWAAFKSASVWSEIVNGRSAETLFNDDYSYWTKNNNSMWDLCLRQAGI